MHNFSLLLLRYRILDMYVEKSVQNNYKMIWMGPPRGGRESQTREQPKLPIIISLYQRHYVRFAVCAFLCACVWNNVNTNSMQKSEHSKNANSRINEVLNACCNQLINILKSILRVRFFPNAECVCAVVSVCLWVFSSIKLSRSLTHAHTLFPPLPLSSLYSLKMSRILNLFLSLHSNIMLPFQNASASTDDFSIL